MNFRFREFLTKVNQARLGIKREVPYINTGMLLLNLPALREHVRMEDLRNYVNVKKNAMLLPDQDILTDRILAFYNPDPSHEKFDLTWGREHGVIIHYCGKNKPWNGSCSGVLDVFYKELCQHADF